MGYGFYDASKIGIKLNIKGAIKHIEVVKNSIKNFHHHTGCYPIEKPLPEKVHSERSRMEHLIKYPECEKTDAGCNLYCSGNEDKLSEWRGPYIKGHNFSIEKRAQSPRTGKYYEETTLNMSDLIADDYHGKLFIIQNVVNGKTYRNIYYHLFPAKAHEITLGQKIKLDEVFSPLREKLCPSETPAEWILAYISVWIHLSPED